MNVKLGERRYCRTHEWVEFEDGDTALVGISRTARSLLGTLTALRLPKKGQPVTVGEVFCEAESKKCCTEFFSPVTGIVTEVNGRSEEDPDTLTSEDWLFRCECVSDCADTLDEAEYAVLTRD